MTVPERNVLRQMAVQIAAGLVANPEVVRDAERPFEFLSDNTNGTATRIAAAAVRVAREILGRLP